MSQHNSGYARRLGDDYATPEWVTAALIPHLPLRAFDTPILECAAGAGKMFDTLNRAGFKVFRRDRVYCGGSPTAKVRNYDFLADNDPVPAVITNPPFRIEVARHFIERGLALTEPHRGFCALLLRTDKGHAKTLRHLFRDCAQFARKVELLKRIVWFPRPGAAPSFNHAWFIWDWQHVGPPTIGWGPSDAEMAKIAAERKPGVHAP